MRSCFLLSLFISLSALCFAQECPPFQSDTMGIPGAAPVSGQYMETQLRDQATVRVFKTGKDKLYLRLIVTENFYFNKVDLLEIKSGTKSYYVKNIKQHKIDKTHGLFVTEIYRNYLHTLMDHGITSIVFGGAETKFTKQDLAQVKQLAGCVYASLPKE
jgi:hypothetical protein